MKTLLTSTAMALMLATGAMADSHVAANADMAVTTGFEASDLMGMRVYTPEAAGTDQWNDIGEINDVLMTMDGKAPSVVVGVGGFLGIGEKSVAVPLDMITVQADKDGKPFLVANMTQADLEAAPDYQKRDLTVASADGITATDTMVTTAATDTTATTTTADASTMTTTAPMAPTMEKDGYTIMASGDVTAETLTGARVNDVKDNDIGEISDLVLNADGKITDVIIDVGGFLGIGEKSVSLPFDQITVLKADAAADADVRIYVDTTEDALKAMPNYEG